VRELDLIFFSDVYGSLEIVEELIGWVEENRLERVVYIIAGDLGSSPRLEERYGILSRLASDAEYLLYVPGDTDPRDISYQASNVVNLDSDCFLIEGEGVKLGFIGLGGAPKHSVAEGASPNLYDESVPIVRDSLLTSLKIRIEKLVLSKPDYIILVTHSPPYGIADKSLPISLKEIGILEEHLSDTISHEEKRGAALRKPTSTIRRLGSRIIKEFVENYKPDIHVFGHVHKEGGREVQEEQTLFFNVSHLAPTPYKLTGRKFLQMRFEKNRLLYRFNHLVETDLAFKDFVERYL
jgi:Icc-related predicted phosphoesterase